MDILKNWFYILETSSRRRADLTIVEDTIIKVKILMCVNFCIENFISLSQETQVIYRNQYLNKDFQHDIYATVIVILGLTQV